MIKLPEMAVNVQNQTGIWCLGPVQSEYGMPYGPHVSWASDAGKNVVGNMSGGAVEISNRQRQRAAYIHPGVKFSPGFPAGILVLLLFQFSVL